MNLGSDKAFLEFEHKFVVDPEQKKQFIAAIAGLNPEKSYQVIVDDHYFYKRSHPEYIFRYRRDDQLNQLTVKDLRQDAESRREVNIDLAREVLIEPVEAFLASLGEGVSLRITKDVFVAYFSDVEIVYYEARSKEKLIACVEIETRKSFEDPRQVIATYERRLGLNPTHRCKESLFQMMVEDQLT